MKKLVTTILSLVCYLTSFAQLDFENPPWETGCDSLTTQTEMNICSYEKFTIADSILNSYYDQLIKYVDSQYERELKESKDTIDVFEKEYLQQLKDQKAAIIKSKTDFREFLNSTTDIVDIAYKGGSMRPMVVNFYALDLTVKQIKVLINLMDEIIGN
jgi:uncharacterized protein YecT (DUF1311 family)